MKFYNVYLLLREDIKEDDSKWQCNVNISSEKKTRPRKRSWMK